jgi:hypothetical protein
MRPAPWPSSSTCATATGIDWALRHDHRHGTIDCESATVEALRNHHLSTGVALVAQAAAPSTRNGVPFRKARTSSTVSR